MGVPKTSQKEQVLKLIEQKDLIEKRINDQGRVLRAVSKTIYFIKTMDAYVKL